MKLLRVRTAAALLLFLIGLGCTQAKTSPWVDLHAVNREVEKSGSQDPVLEAEEGRVDRSRVTDMSDATPGGNEFLQNVSPTGKQEKKEVLDAGVVLNFDNADIYEFIQVITETLGINYIVDPKVKGTVNIRSGQKIGKNQLFTVFQKILHINGLDVRNEGEYYYIHPAKGGAPQKVYGPNEAGLLTESSNMVMQVIPVVHLASSEAQKLIEPYRSDSGTLYNLANQNTLIVYDFESKVLDMVSVLGRLDISPLAALKIRLIRVENAPLFTLRDELQEILAALSINPKDYEGVTLIPLERVNSLLLVSKSEQLLDNADRWIRELDVVPVEGRDNIYFYNVRNSVASELATLVTSLIEGDTSPKLATSPIKKSESIESQLSGLDKSKESEPAKPEGAAAATLTKTQKKKTSGEDKKASMRFAGDPLLLADDSRNIILIRALTPDYTRVVKLLERLDNLPRQVLIEVLVAEVTLDGSWEFGIEWALKNNKLKINDSKYKQTFGTNFTNVAENAVGGFAYTIYNSINDPVGLLNALASETDVTFLSSPQVLVLNNEQATVNVGDQVPIVTTQTERTSTEQPIYDKTVQYKDTGTILKVTPRINYDGVIILDINQQVSQATDKRYSDINSPTISTRELKTKLAVKDGQSIMMGGLISKNNTITESKVPLLGDIPGVGWLFKYQKDSNVKTELVVMITPYVIESDDVLDQYIKKFQEKMAGLRKDLAIGNKEKAEKKEKNSGE